MTITPPSASPPPPAASAAPVAPRRTISRAPLTSGRSRGWVLVVTILLCLVPILISIENLLLSTEVSPSLAAWSAIVWSLYTIPFLIIIRRIDYFEREPWVSLVAAFVWGGFVAAGMAITANSAIFDLVTVSRGVLVAQEWGAALAGPTTEEIAKGLGVLLILLASPRRPRTALDGFVIGAIVGLGFQVVENFGYTMNVSAIEDDPSLSPLVQMFVVRGLIAGPFSHAVYTGIVGLGIGYLLTATHRSWWRRIGVAVLAFVGAYFAHWLWNSPLLLDELGFLSLLIKGLVTISILIVGLRIARRNDSTFFVQGLTGVPDYLCSPQEQQQLATGKSRKQARKAAKRVGGRSAKKAMAALQRAQADLAVAVRVGDDAAAQNATQRIEAARHQLPAGQLPPGSPPAGPTAAQSWPAPVADAVVQAPGQWSPPSGPPVA